MREDVGAGHSRLGQTREVFVGHSADPLVRVVEVDEQELSVSLQLLLVLFGLGLKPSETEVYY